MMSSIFTEAATKLETELTEILTAAGWVKRSAGLAAYGEFTIGKTSSPHGEVMGLFCEWVRGGAVATWPITIPAATIAEQVRAEIAKVQYPKVRFQTNVRGEATRDNVPRAVLDQVPFEDGPGNVQAYLVCIEKHNYALGILEVAYASPAWPDRPHPPKEDAYAVCAAAMHEMRIKSAPGVIIFPLDHDAMPDRCVISVAVPLRGHTRKEVKKRLDEAFAGYASHAVLFRSRHLRQLAA
jgi:hypothetical protein